MIKIGQLVRVNHKAGTSPLTDCYGIVISREGIYWRVSVGKKLGYYYKNWFDIIE